MSSRLTSLPRLMLLLLVLTGCTLPPANHASLLPPALLMRRPTTQAGAFMGGNTVGVGIGRVTPLPEQRAYDLNLSAGPFHAALDGGYWMQLSERSFYRNVEVKWVYGLRFGGSVGAGTSWMGSALQDSAEPFFQLNYPDGLYGGGSLHVQAARRKRRKFTSFTAGIGGIVPVGVVTDPGSCDLDGCDGYFLHLTYDAGIRRDFPGGYLGFGIQSVVMLPIPMLSGGITF